MASASDVPLKTYKPLYSRDLLKGKVAFVTGGGSGICFRIVELMMRHGADAVIASRSLPRVTEAAKRLEAGTGRACMAVSMDVRKPDAVVKAVEAAVARFGKIDILVNGAAGNFLCPASGLSYKGFKTVMEIDAIGSWNVARAVFDASFKDHGGVILNITATLHYKGDLLQAHAGTAKAAIDGMTKHLANEWGQHGVRVNCVAPGPIADTEGFRRLGGFMPQEVLDKFATQGIPLQRFGSRTDIGNAALYLCSEASSYVTGISMVVDGGAWFRGSDTMMADAMMKSAPAKL